MSYTELLAEAERELDRLRVKASRVVASVRAQEVVVESLRAAATVDSGDLTGMRRTDAILAVLRRSSSSLSPTEITGALRAGGRDDDPRSVTATLDHLLKAGSVQRPSRGRYLAV